MNLDSAIRRPESNVDDHSPSNESASPPVEANRPVESEKSQSHEKANRENQKQSEVSVSTETNDADDLKRIEVVIADARDRLKLEQDRHAQTLSRANVYFVMTGVVLSAVLQNKSTISALSDIGARTGFVLCILSIIASLISVALALLAKRFPSTPEPDHFLRLATEKYKSILDFQIAYAEELCKTASTAIKHNKDRAVFLSAASVTTYVAIVSFSLSVLGYLIFAP